MIARPARPPARLRVAFSPLTIGLPILLLSGCEKLPLLAPTEATITLSAGSLAVPASGSTEIIATVIEQAGTPAHNGTVVTFTTTLGMIEPREARTRGGTVTVRFVATGASGVARIGAFSGAARAEELEIRVGGAAAERILLNATPATVSSRGGTVDLVAVVTDAGGNGLAGVTVTFTVSAGALSSSTAVTDGNGEARTRLTTDRETTVTATAGAQQAQATVRASNAPGISLTTSGTPTAGQPTTFTVTVTPGGSAVREATIDFGDGDSQSLGVLTASASITHTYRSAGAFVATAEVVDQTGERTTASTTVAVAPPTRPTITITPSPTSPTVGQAVTFAISVSLTATGVQVTNVTIAFGDGTVRSLGTVSLASVSHVYASEGTFTVTVTVSDNVGTTTTASTSVRVGPPTRPTIRITLPTSTITAGQPTTFTIAVDLTATGVQIRGVTVAFGDGEVQSLGAVTSASVTHVYRTEGTFTVTVTATDSLGIATTGSIPVRVAPPARPTIAITPPTSAFVGEAATFTVSVSLSATGVQVREMQIAFGDGTVRSLGVLTGPTFVTHVYRTDGIHTVTVTVTDSTNLQTSASTTLNVSPARSLSVTLSFLPAAPSVNAVVTFTATVTPDGTDIRSYQWSWGDGSQTQTSGKVTTHVYTTSGRKTVTVSVAASDGRTAEGILEIVVQ